MPSVFERSGAGWLCPICGKWRAYRWRVIACIDRHQRDIDVKGERK